jgi:hypothetical protein
MKELLFKADATLLSVNSRGLICRFGSDADLKKVADPIRITVKIIAATCTFIGRCICTELLLFDK